MGESVSVIIPTYNCGAYIVRAVESALNQTVPLHEIVVVDDGSSDETELKLRPFSDRIVYIRQDNQGAAAARNRGLRAITGAWVAFLDADDVWLPEKIERQMALLGRYPDAVACYCRLQNVTANGDNRDVYPEKVCASSNDKQLVPYWACLQMLPQTSTIVANTQTIRDLGGFMCGLATAEDQDLWVRLLGCGPIVAVQEVMVTRQLRGDSLTHTHSTIAQCYRCLDVLQRRRAQIRRWGGPHAGAGRCFAHTLIAEEHLRASRRLRAIDHSFRALLRPHRSRGRAAKILIESLIGPELYGVGARLARRYATAK